MTTERPLTGHDAPANDPPAVRSPTTPPASPRSAEPTTATAAESTTATAAESTTPAPGEDSPADGLPADNPPSDGPPTDPPPADKAPNVAPAQDEPVQDEPAQDEPAQKEPAQEEPAQDEPAAADTATGGPSDPAAMPDAGNETTTRRRLGRLLSRLPRLTRRAGTGAASRPDTVVGDATGTAPPPPPTEASTTTEPQDGEPQDGESRDGESRDGGPGADAPGLVSARPPGVPPDPWTAFATTPERQPGRLRRAVRALGRAFVHEYALVSYAALVLAVAMTWPALRYPLHTMSQDLFDPSVQAWQLAWTGHSLLTDPAQLWQANAFFPERFSLVYSDSLLGYAPLGMIGSGAVAAVLRYNLVYVAAHALLFIGTYALVRQLGAGRTGAAVAAMAFAYAPWRLAQEGHLHILSAGGIPLAFAMLARGHGWSLRYGFRPRRRHVGWVVAGWIVATWQFSLGLALGLPFAYALGVVVLVSAVAVLVRRLRRRAAGPVLGRRVLIADALGMVGFAGLGLLVTLPYLRVALLYPDAGRAGGEIEFFSPPPHSLLVAPAESRIWGAAHAVPRAALPWAPEMTLLPGFTLYALALAGLLFSLWTLRQRLLLLLGVLVTAVLTLGTTFFDGRWTYLPLFAHVPTWTGLRTPGLLVLWPTLLLGVLAAGAVGEFVRRIELMAAQRVPPWPGPWSRAATLVPLLLVAVEGLGATSHPVVPDQPAAMRTVDGPLMVLPSDRLGDQLVMLWSTSRFQQLANGGAGFVPQRQEELRRATTTFPDAASIQYLRGLGIKRVVLLREQAVGTPWERAGDVPVDTLGIQREDLDDAVVFKLS